MQKDEVKNIEPETLFASGVLTLANDGKSYVCPECGNGTGDTGNGLVVYHNAAGYDYHCFKCGTHFDNIALLAYYYRLDCQRDFVEILRRADDLFGGTCLNPTKKILPVAQDSVKNKNIEKEIEFDICTAMQNFRDNRETLPVAERRGLSTFTLDYFCCGVISDWVHPLLRHKKNIQPTRRIIIPTTLYSYNAILFRGDRNFVEKKYWKMQAGKFLLFGRQTITSSTKYIFVFEGEIDAMSAYQANKENDFLGFSSNVLGAYEAQNLTTNEITKSENTPFAENAYLATGGAAAKKWIEFLDLICIEKRIKPAVLIVFDNDEAGMTNAKKHCAELIKRGYPAKDCSSYYKL